MVKKTAFFNEFADIDWATDYSPSLIFCSFSDFCNNIGNFRAAKTQGRFLFGTSNFVVIKIAFKTAVPFEKDSFPSLVLGVFILIAAPRRCAKNFFPTDYVLFCVAKRKIGESSD
ncbi:MAG: hypothetical protein Q4C95_07855 [Planctomycetia bacterium]|nr:hypothetical protein [Planctomycetia bacterium]